MATVTLGTNATSSLTALLYRLDQSSIDVAAVAAAIKNDLNPTHPIEYGAFENNGLLFIPRRGVLKVLPGDYVGVDNQGWPILVSANSIASAAWTHT